MESIFEDTNRRVINKTEDINFDVSSAGIYIIQIAARATNTEILKIKIDQKEYFSKPVVFSGKELKGLKKSIFWISQLNFGPHTISLIPQPISTLEQVKVYSFTGELLVNDQAEDGDRRPWITFITVNFSLKSITPVITYTRRKRDSDDVKIIIDGQTQGNLFRSIKHFLWRYAGSLLPNFFPKTETEIFNVNPSQGIHYVEFFADRMPILNTISFGATNFHSFTNKKDFPGWATEENFKIKLGDIYFYELES